MHALYIAVENVHRILAGFRRHLALYPTLIYHAMNEKRYPDVGHTSQDTHSARFMLANVILQVK